MKVAARIVDVIAAETGPCQFKFPELTDKAAQQIADGLFIRCYDF